MNIKKRNGAIVEFDVSKVVNAIYNAHLEVDVHATKELAEYISKDVERICNDETEKGRVLTVECIQDIIEEQLMEGNKQVAKRYILYREEKSRNRANRKRYKYLSDEFLSKYKHREAPLNPLGNFVFYRTYSRFLPEEGRREYWWETIARAVDYNCSLAPNTTKAEAEALYDNIYNLRQQLSGRTLYTGGTQASLQYVLSNYNCSYTTIEHIDDFCDLFYVLMVGTGAGVGIQRKYVEKLPPFRTDVNLFHSEWEFTPKPFREDITSTEVNGDTIKIIVGDSKEGFLEGLRTFMQVLTSHSYRTIKNIIMDYNYVRPKGERLVTFGGYASGHESMKNMIHKIYKVIMSKESNGKKVTLDRIDVMDIANIIGENVVSGGVRRTAEIMFIDLDDIDTQNAKNNLYMKDIDGNWSVNQNIIHRMMSNNSIIYEEKPSREQLHAHIEKMRFSGEPAVVNAEAARKRRDNFKGLNPCAEILLDSKGVCNLTTVNMMSFVVDGKLDVESMLGAFKLATRAGYRMTNVDLELYNWDRVQKRDRLLGVSMTGYQEMVGAVDLSIEEQKELLEKIRETTHIAMKEIAKELGLNESLLITTVKPEGTLSQVFGGVSSGLHFPHSEYFIRRVRINAFDPLAKVAEELGWSVKPEVGQDWETCTTKVIEFPVYSPANQFKKDVSAIDQLEVYKMFQSHYTDHNSSITVSVKNGEWEQVEQWLWDNWDDFIGVSFLSEDDSFYQLMPYEEIDKETYEKMFAETAQFNPTLLKKYETTGTSELDENESCQDGACSVR